MKRTSYISSGQIIATSHEFSPKMVFFFFLKGNSLISGKSGLVKYYNLTRSHGQDQNYL